MYSSIEIAGALTEQSAKKPFSFLYEGKSFDFSKILPETEQETPGKTRIRYSLIPGLLQLTLELIRYQDFPVIEYTPYLENTGDRPTGIISDFKNFDWVTEVPSFFGEGSIRDWVFTNDKKVRIRYHIGSACSPADFLPQTRDLFPMFEKHALELKCFGGRCSDTFLPFMGIDLSPRSGLNLAIGWSGAWKFNADLETQCNPCQGGKDLRISTGMLDSHFRILPGEKLMQPGILLHFREDKTVNESRNEFRRFMIAHHSPRNAKGVLQKPPVALAVWGGLESGPMLRRIETIKKHKLPYEEFWIDAGWMGSNSPCPHFCENSSVKSDWPDRVGSWDTNRYAHPNGIKEISEAAHAAGLRMLVWFEPERISRKSGSALLTEHRDWLLSTEHGNSDLLNLGNPEAREYLTKTVGDILEQEKIDDYRQDFNTEPLIYWRTADAPDRQGVTEMKYIEGLYLFWQALRKRFPDLFIDNCASGGRRLDYKLASMSFPLCQSDYATLLAYNEECIQFENLYLDQWLPLHGSLNWGEKDPYHAFSAMGNGYASKIWQFNGRDPGEDHDYDTHRKILLWGKMLRDLKLTGDVKILVDSPEEDRSRWCAEQIHDPAEETGAVLAFRHQTSPNAVQLLTLDWIQEDAQYEIEYFSGKKKTLSGKDLLLYAAELKEPRSSLLFRYKRLISPSSPAQG